MLEFLLSGQLTMRLSQLALDTGLSQIFLIASEEARAQGLDVQLDAYISHLNQQINSQQKVIELVANEASLSQTKQSVIQWNLKI